MAPELFDDNGVYTLSIRSLVFNNFIMILLNRAFGCVLYELAVGHPPFVSTSFTELVTYIVNVS